MLECDMMTKCNVIFCVEFWDRKRKLSKNQENLNNVWTLINNTESRLVH